MRLVESFTDDVQQIDLIATAYNINYGHNKELMEKCEQIMYYSIFVSKVEEYRAEGYEAKIAVRKASDYCIHHNIMKEFLAAHQEEVIDMFTEEWNLDEAMKVSKEEGKIEGKIEGTLEAIKNLMKNTKCSAQNAMTNLGVNPNEFSKYMAML